MSYQDLLYGVDGKVATITLNRPDRMNALSRNLEAEIHRALDEADADRNVRAIILTGAGAAFSAGYGRAAARSAGQEPRRIY
jgi:enoyl-CoA hydratase/carnithine racemase